MGAPGHPRMAWVRDWPRNAVRYDGIRLYDSGGGAASKYTLAILYSNIRVRYPIHNTNNTIDHIWNHIQTVLRPYGKPDSHRTANRIQTIL